MGNSQLSPVAAGLIILVVVAVAGFFLWRATSPPQWTGGPVDMGAMMKAGAGHPGGTSH